MTTKCFECGRSPQAGVWVQNPAPDAPEWVLCPECARVHAEARHVPTRICCGQRHFGSRCPDGTEMCHLCWQKFKGSEMAPKDCICKECLRKENEALASKAELLSQPVFEGRDGWYHFDEVWTEPCGPYDSQADAEFFLAAYLDEIEYAHMMWRREAA